MEMQKYIHNCDGCKFLGHLLGHDLYFCNKSLDTVILRFGNNPPDYLSGPLYKRHYSDPAIAQAKGDKELILLLLFREAYLRHLESLQ